jgi:hypothetical protein
LTHKSYQDPATPRGPKSRAQTRKPPGRATPKGTKPQRPNKTRRRLWSYLVATDHRLSRGCRAFLLLIANRSSDDGKVVYGRQTNQARDLACCDRTIRRYRAEGERAGYLHTVRWRPERGRDGHWTRQQTNRYYMATPAQASPDDAPAPEHAATRTSPTKALVRPCGHHRPVEPPYGVVKPPDPVESEPAGGPPTPLDEALANIDAIRRKQFGRCEPAASQ